MLKVRCNVSNGPGADARVFARNGDLNEALADQEDFLVNVMMRRMGSRAGGKLGFMQFNVESGMSGSIQDRPGLIPSMGADGQVLKREHFARNQAAFGRARWEGGRKRRQKQA